MKIGSVVRLKTPCRYVDEKFYGSIGIVESISSGIDNIRVRIFNYNHFHQTVRVEDSEEL